MYAVIETGGKQYRVSVGQSIEVERLPTTVGQTVEIKKVLLLADNGQVVIGTPRVKGAKVRATVLEQKRGRKLVVFKFRGGNRYHRKGGHRQSYTTLRIDEILRPGARPERATEEAVAAQLKEAAPEEAGKPVAVSLDELGLPTRTVGLLKRAGVVNAEDLLSRDDEELLAIRGFGTKSLEQVRASLKAKGLVK